MVVATLLFSLTIHTVTIEGASLCFTLISDSYFSGQTEIYVISIGEGSERHLSHDDPDLSDG